VPVEVLPLDPRAAGYEKAGGVRTQLAAAPAVLRQARRLAAMAREFDVIYTNTQKAFVIGAVAGAFARRPVVWHLRDMLTAGHFSNANRRVAVTLANRFARLVICNSQATADAFLAAGGRPGEKVRVVYNGIDPEPFDAVSDEDAAGVRHALEIPAEAFVVGVFGRLTPWKGQDVLLDAAARLIAPGSPGSPATPANPATPGTPGTPGAPPLHVLVVGEALFTPEDQAYAKQLRSRAAAGPLAGRVHLLGFRDDIAAVMKACDAVVHCSTQPEPFGRVIVEGMLAGRAVVAANAGGAAEIVRDGETGLLTPPGDAAALAEALHTLRTDAGRAARLAAAGRADAVERFSVDAMGAAIEELLTTAR